MQAASHVEEHLAASSAAKKLPTCSWQPLLTLRLDLASPEPVRAAFDGSVASLHQTWHSHFPVRLYCKHTRTDEPKEVHSIETVLTLIWADVGG